MRKGQRGKETLGSSGPQGELRKKGRRRSAPPKGENSVSFGEKSVRFPVLSSSPAEGEFLKIP